MRLKSAVGFIGPLPPPVHGFSEINKKMTQALSRSYDVELFNTAPSDNFVRAIWNWIRFVFYVFKRRPKSIYLGFSGGTRQWVDAAYLAVANFGKVPVFIHHHSFSYLNENLLRTRVCFQIAKKATHIVLCDCMKDELSKNYAVPASAIRVLSNVAFLSEIRAPLKPSVISETIRIGFLSNITEGKGIFEFLTVLQESPKHGVNLFGIIAGPVHASVQQSFDLGLKATANAEHIGAVYGEAKQSFFSAIDVLLFPTKLNEGEPVTILEAFGNGVPVIAFSRGCIGSMVPENAGATLTYSEDFVAKVMEALRRLAGTPALLCEARQAARATFEEGFASNKEILNNLIAEIGGVFIPSLSEQNVRPSTPKGL